MSQPIEPFKSTPKRPYLLRAFYEWIVDNGLTPHILVDARSDQVRVPRQFVKNGNIVLNISMSAANNLMMRNDEITFNARFGGKAFSIWLPIWAVMAIYSRETQEGISFPADEYDELMHAVKQTQSRRPTLSAVPNQSTDDTPAAASDTEAEETVDAELDDDPPPEPPKPSDKARPPFLRVVK